MTTIYRNTENKLLKVVVEDHYVYIGLNEEMYINGRKYIVESINFDFEKDRRNIIVHPAEDIRLSKIDYKYKVPM